MCALGDYLKQQIKEKYVYRGIQEFSEQILLKSFWCILPSKSAGLMGPTLQGRELAL
jgi:hypothetical protein